MTTHMTGTREEWLAARLELLEAEKELTRRGDELARRRQALPWVRIDKEYRFDTDAGSASLADLFKGRSQLLVYHFMFGPDYTAGCPSCSIDRGRVQRLRRASGEPRRHALGGVAGAAGEASGLSAADGVDVSLGVLARHRLQLRLQRRRSPRSSSAKGRVEYNYERGGHAMDAAPVPAPVAQFAATCGTDAPTYARDRPGMSAFVLEDGVVYHSLLDLCARTGRPLGHVPVARPRAQGTQRDGHLVAPPRRIRQGLTPMLPVRPRRNGCRRPAADRPLPSSPGARPWLCLPQGGEAPAAASWPWDQALGLGGGPPHASPRWRC